MNAARVRVRCVVEDRSFCGVSLGNVVGLLLRDGTVAFVPVACVPGCVCRVVSFGARGVGGFLRVYFGGTVKCYQRYSAGQRGPVLYEVF